MDFSKSRQLALKVAIVASGMMLASILVFFIWNSTDVTPVVENQGLIDVNQNVLNNINNNDNNGGAVVRAVGGAMAIATQTTFLTTLKKASPIIISVFLIAVIVAVVTAIAIYYRTLDDVMPEEDLLINRREKQTISNRKNALLVFVVVVGVAISSIIFGTGIYYHNIVRKALKVKPPPKPPVEFVPDKVLGNRYKLLHVLGSGGFGEVWKALDTQNKDTLVAIKRVKPKKPVDKEQERKNQEANAKLTPSKRKEVEEAEAARQKEKHKTALRDLKNESNLLKGFKHDNILKHIDYLDDEDAMVVEYLGEPSRARQGFSAKVKSFAARVKRKFSVMTEEELKSYMRQLLSAVAYLHEQRIMHLDIKPDNILMSNDRKVVKLIDFGLARSFDKPGGTKGTVEYMAPEMMREKSTFNEKADIWCVGITAIKWLIESPYGNISRETEIKVNDKDKDKAKEPPTLQNAKDANTTVVATATPPKDDGNQKPAPQDATKAKADEGSKMVENKEDTSSKKAKRIILKKIDSGKFPMIPQKVSEPCKNFIRKCLTVDPKNRPSAKDLLENDPWLKSLDNQTPTTATTTPPPSP